MDNLKDPIQNKVCGMLLWDEAVQGEDRKPFEKKLVKPIFINHLQNMLQLDQTLRYTLKTLVLKNVVLVIQYCLFM